MDAGNEGFGNGGIRKRRYLGKEGFGKGGSREMRDLGKERGD